MDGTVERVTLLGGQLFSVKPVALRSQLDVLGENRRLVVELRSAAFGSVLFVAVGASEVGSIGLAVSAGQRVVKVAVRPGRDIPASNAVRR